MSTLFTDIFAFLGVALIGYGCWLVYQPAGYISSGALLVLFAIIGALRSLPAPEPPHE